MATVNRSSGVADRLSLWLSRHWLALLNTVVAVYLGLPFAAPVLMKFDHPFAARIVYGIYAPLCHQLPQRSYFLFGEQAVYSFDELGKRLDQEQLPAIPWAQWPKPFNGNPQVGYKVALCQRDIAIWGGMLLGGLLFSLFRTRIKPLPFWAFLLIGLVPIGLDGGSQLISKLAAWYWPHLGIMERESTWLLRALTGGLFGGTAAWVVFPYLQTAFAEIAETASRRATELAPPITAPGP